MSSPPDEELLKILFDKLILFNMERERIKTVIPSIILVKAIQAPNVSNSGTQSEIYEEITDLLKKLMEGI